MAGLLSWHRDSPSSLFERIQKEDVSPSFDMDVNELINSIKRNLSNILNSHPGASQSAKELGIVDLNDVTSNAIDIHNNISFLVKRCILDYEPRISDVYVKPLIDHSMPLTLFFYIEATVNVEEFKKRITFNLHLDNDQRYYVDLNNI